MKTSVLFLFFGGYMFASGGYKSPQADLDQSDLRRCIEQKIVNVQQGFSKAGIIFTPDSNATDIALLNAYYANILDKKRVVFLIPCTIQEEKKYCFSNILCEEVAKNK